MAAPNPPQLLVSGLLDGIDVVLAGAQAELAATCSALGARIVTLDADLLDEDALTSAAQALAAADVLVCDTGPALRAGGGEATVLADAVAGAWSATRAVLTAKLAPAGYGLVLLVAPRPRDGELAQAAGAALENLARTTSVEWARLGVRVVAVRPRDVTSDAALAQLIAFLSSPAGAYFSGCVLDLGAAGISGYSAGDSSASS